MTAVSKSYEKVHYEFRPAKQVERRMLLDVFQRLMSVGFAIQDYQYTGLGSIYFIDFIMFHRYLGIQEMLSVEISADVEKRVRFNRPYESIRVEIGDISDQIPLLSAETQHILWLDYDFVISEDVLDAIVLASSQLSPGSLLLVTLDVEPPGPSEDGPRDWKTHYYKEANRFLKPSMKNEDFARSKLPLLNASIIEKAISEGLVGRTDVSFRPLFSFVYADGHEMLSIGGMIASSKDKAKLGNMDWNKLSFVRDDLYIEPFRIKVPLITRKERFVLDASMPSAGGWTPTEFEMRIEDIDAYCEIYRYYPAFTEMFL
ncbi:MAG TPA: O-methyltransferase [Aridibacter sp.]|nr:O-methyltransferase [Aridibacter sp.]